MEMGTLKGLLSVITMHRFFLYIFLNLIEKKIRDQINRVGKEVATRAFGVAIQTNPSLNAINNTVGAVQDYRKGEDVSEIMKHRYKFNFYFDFLF